MQHGFNSRLQRLSRITYEQENHNLNWLVTFGWCDKLT